MHLEAPSELSNSVRKSGDFQLNGREVPQTIVSSTGEAKEREVYNTHFTIVKLSVKMIIVLELCLLWTKCLCSPPNSYVHILTNPEWNSVKR